MKNLSSYIAILAILVAGCAEAPRINRPAADDIAAAAREAATQRAQSGPVAPAVLQALLPEVAALGSPAIEEDPRFDLKVSNLPAPQLLNALVTDTSFSMVVHPSIKDVVSLNLKRVTLREVLRSLSELYDYEFRTEDKVIYAMPAGLQTRLFTIDYLTAQRFGSSELRVASNSHATQTATGPGAAGTGTSQASAMQTMSTNNFWGELRTVLAALAGCSIAQQAATGTGTATAAAATQNQSPLARAALRAEQQLYAPIQCPDGRELIVSPQSGTIMVRSFPRELRQVSEYVSSTLRAAERQVLIEAKVLEVTLRDGFQTGINWAAFFGSGRLGAGMLAPGVQLGTTGSTAGLASPGLIAGSSTQAMAAGNRALSAGASAAGTFFGMALQASNFASLMTFLETQGVVHTLSSPRIATMNNQKAVLKVGSDALFVTRVSGGTTTTTVAGAAPTVTSPTFDVESFFSGIALDVTPQISADGNIQLHVRPSISEVSQNVQTLNLGSLGTFSLPLVNNSVSETDSVIRAQDGQIVALGGLMRSADRQTRNQVPGAGSSTAFGSLFRNVDQASEKRELVILLKPSIVRSDSDWARENRTVSNRLERLRNLPGAVFPGDAFGTNP